MFNATLHIGKHLFISLFNTFSSSIVNPSQQLVFVEIEFLAFLIGRKQPFAYQCIMVGLAFLMIRQASSISTNTCLSDAVG